MYLNSHLFWGIFLSLKFMGQMEEGKKNVVLENKTEDSLILTVPAMPGGNYILGL